MMKTLKLIVLMLLTANFVMAQTTYGTNAGAAGNSDDTNAYYGVNAGAAAASTANTFIGAQTGTNAGIGPNNVGIGYEALGLSTGLNNTCIGLRAGRKLTGESNTFIGVHAGLNATSGKGNVGIGGSALIVNAGGQNNLALGNSAGKDNATGGDNVFAGAYAGNDNTSGGSNTYIGAIAGGGQNGNSNVAIGTRAGLLAADSISNTYSVFLGAYAGKNRPTGENHKLYIQSQSQNSTNTIPLIYGDFNSKQLAIDTTYVPNGYTLAVNGKAIIEEVQVMSPDTWPDYVFAEDYELMPLTDLETEIETLGHLPGVPSAEEVEANGHALGRMDAILLEKIEELTLHLIDINKEVKEVRQENKILNADINLLQHENAKLKNEMETLKK